LSFVWLVVSLFQPKHGSTGIGHHQRAASGIFSHQYLPAGSISADSPANYSGTLLGRLIDLCLRPSQGLSIKR